MAPSGNEKEERGIDWRYTPDACCVNELVGVYFLTPILSPKLLHYWKWQWIFINNYNLKSSNLESCVRATKYFANSGGNTYVGIDIVSSFGISGKLQAYPCILATVSDAGDSTLSVTSVKRENDTYIIVFLNKAIASAFNIDLQFLVE